MLLSFLHVSSSSFPVPVIAASAGTVSDKQTAIKPDLGNLISIPPVNESEQ